MLRRTGLMLLLVLVPVAVHAAEVNLRVLADVVVSGDDGLEGLNRMRTQDSYSDFLHTRVFLDAGTERTAVFAQLVLSDTAVEQVRIFGAYIQHQIFEAQELYVQAGKIPNPMGTWGPRTYADHNPLVGLPLGYFWQSGLPVTSVPATIDDLVANADQATTYGAMMLYDNCWNDGIALVGTRDWLSGELAVTRGAPGNPVSGHAKNDALAVQARVGLAPIPEVEVDLSYGRGAYLNSTASADLGPGQSVNEYMQDIFVGSLHLSRGYFDFHGELFLNHYQTPLRDAGLGSWSTTGQLEWAFAAGWYAAVRYDLLRFEEVETTAGKMAWDTDIDRIEGGVGYHFSRNFMVKAVVQASDFGDGYDDALLPMLQAVAGF